MTTKTFVAPDSDRDLVLTRVFDAPPAEVFKAWTDPETMKRFFAPRPYTTPVVEVDVRPGGSSLVVMRGPDGEDIRCPGVYLEVVKNERLVFTDAFTEAWKPAEKAFMTVTLTFEEQGGKTKYTARVSHWTVADREAHETMGFHEGWSQVAEQLAEVLAGK